MELPEHEREQFKLPVVEKVILFTCTSIFVISCFRAGYFINEASANSLYFDFGRMMFYVNANIGMSFLLAAIGLWREKLKILVFVGMAIVFATYVWRYNETQSYLRNLELDKTCPQVVETLSASVIIFRETGVWDIFVLIITLITVFYAAEHFLRKHN